MLCTHCGSEISENENACPNCGIALNTANHSTETKPKTAQRRMPLWFKIAVGVALLALIAVTVGIFFTESLVDVVEHQMNALRNQDIEKAYKDYTSKAFQESTSFDQFRDFIEAHPLMIKSPISKFTQRSIDKNIATIKGELTSSDHVKTPIEFKVIREEGKWKILSIRLLKKQSSNKENSAQALIEQIKSQLKYIQSGKIDLAYEEFASREFKLATNLPTFKEYIKKYPIFNQYKTASFHRPKINGNAASLSVLLHSSETAAYLKYYLIFDGVNWKVWSLRILSPEEHENEKEVKKEQAAALRNHQSSSNQVAGIIGYPPKKKQKIDSIAKLPQPGLFNSVLSDNN